MLVEVLKNIGFDSDQRDAIKKLLYILNCDDSGIKFDSLKTYDWFDSLTFGTREEAYEWLNSTCQTRMLRPKNVERLQYVPPKYVEEYLSTVIKYLDRLHLVNHMPPKHRRYDAMLLLGAAQDSFEKRVKSAIEVLHDGSHIPEMYILSGDRDLWPKHEPFTPIMLTEVIADKINADPYETRKIYQDICELINKYLPHTVFQKNTAAEINEIRLKTVDIFENPKKHKAANPCYPPIKWPNEMYLGRSLVNMYKMDNIIEIFEADTPKNSKGGRPNTFDTFIKFEQEFGQKFVNKKRKPKLLLVSNQPFNLYQKMIAENALPKHKYDLDVVGVGSVAITPQSVAVCLDSLARTIYAAGFKFKKA